jgi:hypothetical protein
MSVSVTTMRVAGVADAAGVGAGVGEVVGAGVGAAAAAAGAAVHAGADGVEIRRGPTAHAETRVMATATSPVVRRTFKAKFPFYGWCLKWVAGAEAGGSGLVWGPRPERRLGGWFFI